MNTNIEIPKKLLAEIDFHNTLSGGMAESTIKAWASKEGYKMAIQAPGVNQDDIKIEIRDKRFMVFYLIDVLEKTEQIPYFLVNIPLSPDVDINNISARYERNGRIYITAPFNDWAKGQPRNIELE
jgi:HSP20 family molecular chaperone IbpA